MKPHASHLTLFRVQEDEERTAAVLAVRLHSLPQFVLPIWNEGGVPAALLEPGLALPWPWALFPLPSSPGPLIPGIMVGLPAKIFAALGAVLSPALPKLMSWS